MKNFVIAFFLLFLLSIAVRIFLSAQQEVQLVSKSYYPKGVDYQRHIEKLKRTSGLREKIILSQNKDSVILQFPDTLLQKKILGNIEFFRPSNSNFDKHFALLLEKNGMQKFAKSNFSTGKYLIKIEFNADSLEYFQEFDLLIH